MPDRANDSIRLDARLRSLLQKIGLAPRWPLSSLRGEASLDEVRTLHDQGWIECQTDCPAGHYDPLKPSLVSKAWPLLFGLPNPIYCSLTVEGQARLAELGKGPAKIEPATRDTVDVERPPRPNRKRRGRKPDTDAGADKQVAGAWASGQYKTYDELGREKNMSRIDVKRAIDRHRKRR